MKKSYSIILGVTASVALAVGGTGLAFAGGGHGGGHDCPPRGGGNSFISLTSGGHGGGGGKDCPPKSCKKKCHSEDPSTPPSSEPPASEAPTSEPPASEPPASEPPASEPPASEPPASELPASEPPTDNPPQNVIPPKQREVEKKATGKDKPKVGESTKYDRNGDGDVDIFYGPDDEPVHETGK